MKETISVSIDTCQFVLDIDAHDRLKSYLADISSELPPEDRETIRDVESRIAELLNENLPSSMMVVSINLVEHVIKIMGEPSCFKELDGGSTSTNERAEQRQDLNQNISQYKLYRSRTDRALAGVCGGLAKYCNCDSTIIRVITIALAIFGGSAILIYIIMWIIIPEENLQLKNK